MTDVAESENAKGSALYDAGAAGAVNRVFISYASQDVAVAEKLCAALEAASLLCWIAPRDVRAGESYAAAIVRAINSCRMLVLVLSKSAIESSHVLREIERASSKNRPVLTVRVDAAELPPDLEYFLSAKQWLDASRCAVEQILPALVESVRGHDADKTTREAVGLNVAGVRTSPDPRASEAPSKAPPRSGKRAMTVALALVIVGFALLLTGKFWLSKHEAAQRPAAPVTPATTPVSAISEKSIAVLPFADMSEKKDQEYFADGLSEELIDHLAHNPALKVIARTSSFAFKGKNEDMRSIATKLGVANLLEGSIRKAGSELRITAQLIRASDGVHLWSEIYDRKLNDIFKVQDEISTTVAKALNVALNMAPPVSVQPASQSTTDIAAYNLVLKGNYFFWRGEQGDEAKAVELYQQALHRNPRYALAWAKLARAYAWQGYSGELTAAEAEAKGRKAVQRALTIDPNCAEAFYARGNIFWFVVGDWAAATADYERAVSLDPQSDVGEAAQDNILDLKALTSGRFGDLLDRQRHRLERDPLDTSTLFDLAWFQKDAGNLDESAGTYRKLLELNPAYATAQAQYALTLLLLGRTSEALAAAERESDDASKLAALACVYWVLGRRAESDSALGALKRGFADRNGYMIAAAHAYRGEADAAFTWLDRAYQQRIGSLERLRVDPLLRKLHGDARFDALLRKAKLAD